MFNIFLSIKKVMMDYSDTREKDMFICSFDCVIAH